VDRKDVNYALDAGQGCILNHVYLQHHCLVPSRLWVVRLHNPQWAYVSRVLHSGREYDEIMEPAESTQKVWGINCLKNF
jgi:hypothetical protein